MPFRKGEANKYIEIQFVYGDGDPDHDEGEAVDISAATTKEIVVRKSDGSEVALTAAFTNSGTDGKIRYQVTDTAFFSVAGKWSKQGIATFTGGKPWKTEVGYFDVADNL
jgi:hypothetical protein